MNCDKRGFTKRDAQTVLNYIKRKGKSNKRRKECRYYHCPFCNQFHLTSERR